MSCRKECMQKTACLMHPCCSKGFCQAGPGQGSVPCEHNMRARGMACRMNASNNIPCHATELQTCQSVGRQSESSRKKRISPLHARMGLLHGPVLIKVGTPIITSELGKESFQRKKQSNTSHKRNETETRNDTETRKTTNAGCVAFTESRVNRLDFLKRDSPP